MVGGSGDDDGGGCRNNDRRRSFQRVLHLALSVISSGGGGVVGGWSFVGGALAADLEFPSRAVSTLGVGSCAKPHLTTRIFAAAAGGGEGGDHSDDAARTTLEDAPTSAGYHDSAPPLDVWVWLGDIVYLDRMTVWGFESRSFADMRALWDAQKRNATYQQLLTHLARRADAEQMRARFDARADAAATAAAAASSCSAASGGAGCAAAPWSLWASLTQKYGLVAGVWDDHDFGINNGGKEYAHKDVVKEMLLDFLDEPADSPRRSRAGAYVSMRWGGGPGLERRRVKLLLVDVRYFRERPTSGDMIGSEQWAWLEHELRANDAEVTLIGSGIQVLPDDKPLQEKWANYPASRDRLLRLVSEASGTVVLLSGDVHYGELLAHTCASPDYTVYEMTSSGITHSIQSQAGNSSLARFMFQDFMDSRYRVPHQAKYMGSNYGTVAVDWPESATAAPTVTLSVRDDTGRAVRRVSVTRKEGSNSEHLRDPHNTLCEPTPRHWPLKWRLYPVNDWMYYVSRSIMTAMFVVPLALWRCCSRGTR